MTETQTALLKSGESIRIKTLRELMLEGSVVDFNIVCQTGRKIPVLLLPLAGKDVEFVSTGSDGFVLVSHCGDPYTIPVEMIVEKQERPSVFEFLATLDAALYTIEIKTKKGTTIVKTNRIDELRDNYSNLRYFKIAQIKISLFEIVIILDVNL